MHGVIFQQLQSYVTKNYGAKSWLDIVEQAGLRGKVYLPTQVYPDSEIFILVNTASKSTQRSPSDILESFGEYITPALLRIYAGSINPTWSTIDLLEHVENTIHKAVRFADRSATPPQLVCARKGHNKIYIDYSSKRNMVDLGVGIIKAVAKAKNENVSVTRQVDGAVIRLEVEVKV